MLPNVRDDEFDLDDAEEPQKQDVEITLGPAMLFAIACGLLLLCALCFAIGYTAGRRAGSHMLSSAKEAATGQTLNDQATSLRKPAAKGTPPTVQAAARADAPGAVHPAMPAGGVSVAGSPGAGVMVQIAAVSHAEDATVLMGALRKRGYAVTARHVPDDNLIHVQIGPFASRAEATTMSQRLLGDGYNAVVLP